MVDQANAVNDLVASNKKLIREKEDDIAVLNHKIWILEHLVRTVQSELSAERQKFQSELSAERQNVEQIFNFTKSIKEQ